MEIQTLRESIVQGPDEVSRTVEATTFQQFVWLRITVNIIGTKIGNQLPGNLPLTSQHILSRLQQSCHVLSEIRRIYHDNAFTCSILTIPLEYNALGLASGTANSILTKDASPKI